MNQGAMPAYPEWRPIESAPKDGTVIMLGWDNNDFCRPCAGYWEIDKYSKKPRPYWSNDLERSFGTRHARENQPTHWMPLPGAPALSDQPTRQEDV